MHIYTTDSTSRILPSTSLSYPTSVSPLLIPTLLLCCEMYISGTFLGMLRLQRRHTVVNLQIERDPTEWNGDEKEVGIVLRHKETIVKAGHQVPVRPNTRSRPTYTH